MQLDADLPTALVPLAWLIGRWEGAGVVGYPTIESVNFGQEVEFRHDGRPFLHYRSQAWLLDDAGNKVRPLASETGFWRIGADGKERDLEVLLTHPTGFVEIYVGDGGRRPRQPADRPGRPGAQRQGVHRGDPDVRPGGR